LAVRSSVYLIGDKSNFTNNINSFIIRTVLLTKCFIFEHYHRLPPFVLSGNPSFIRPKLPLVCVLISGLKDVADRRRCLL